MNYATVLMHLDDGPRIDERIAFAAQLARQFEGHLVGLAAAERSLVDMGVATGFAGHQQYLEALRASRVCARGRADDFLARTRALCGGACEAVVDDDDEVTALVGRSLCADLLLLGQPDPLADAAGRARGLLERLVLHSAAPTLVLPRAGPFAALGRQVLIAWNGGAESARAVVGALPLLRRASKVHLLRCVAPQDLASAGDATLLEAPRAWLARHGVHVDAWLEASDADAARTLQSRAADLEADLIVMGGWGHARWTERVLGGVTRTLLHTSDLPLLMAH